MTEHVVLLHGMGETRLHMMALEAALRAAGFGVSNIDYPSTRYPSAVLARDHVWPLFDRFADAERLHFVTHSLGGILLHACLREERPANLGRVVMHNPASHGSRVLQLQRPLWLYKLMFGPAGQESGVDADSFACMINAPADYDLGIIAGSFSFDPLAMLVLDWPNDGRTSVRDARMPGARDLISVPASHDLVPFHPWAVMQTIQYLRHGRFFRWNAAQAERDSAWSSGTVTQAMAS